VTRLVASGLSGRSAPLDADVHAAIEASHLRSLSPAMLARLTGDASRLRVPAGSTIYREGHASPHLEIVISGLVRVYVMAPDGRTMTVRYCRPGALIGAASLFASPFSLPASIQAVADTDLLAFRASVVQRAAERDPQVARALIDELGERVRSFIAEIADGSFATVRQRVARHLLALASESQSSPLVVTTGQQELADAVGTVREVVVRALRELRQAGLLATGRHGITLLDPQRLRAESGTGGAGTNVPAAWNLGR
jgi:CRP/FNR family transcriptional regulator, cyclic AMP receptor protein